MDKCEHCINGDDENLLLDDENTKENKCSRCKQVNLWRNGEIGANLNWDQTQNLNCTFDDDESQPIMSTVLDEYAVNLEDSPLLINDCYREPEEKEFHCHDFEDPPEDIRAFKKLMWASIFCCAFMIAELLGGYFSASLAIMTDAAHLLSDCVGFLISLFAIWVGKKRRTSRMTFGYYRAEVLGALLSVTTIWCLAGVFCFLAISRLYSKKYDIDADTMLIVSSVGVVMNIIIGVILNGVCHGHSHGLGHQHTQSKNNINVRAAAAHVIGDLLQSIGVLIAAILIKCNPEAKIADPICTLLFSIIVIWTTIGVGRDSIWILAEGSPLSSAKLALELGRVAGIKHIHNIHIWSLAPGKDAVTVHLAVDPFCDRDLLLKKTTSVIHSQISVLSCTVQIEAYNSQLIKSCRQCQSEPC